MMSVSRAGFYRHFQEHEPRRADVELRHRLQQLALRGVRKLGHRTLARQLRREGIVANHKRVLRLMREDNLLALRKRRYINTTDSNHNLAVYPNLAKHLIVDGLNQLWVSDITYIRLREQFIYLAVILDAHSRRVIGWSLGDSLEAKLTLDALDQALAARPAGPGLVHHSDRGVQYCSREYIKRLEDRGVLVSMSRRGNPYDNAKAERFMRTLKEEEVYLRDYRDIDDARILLVQFIDEVYNTQRLHSKLQYRPPAEFEAALEAEGDNTEKGRVRYGFS